MLARPRPRPVSPPVQQPYIPDEDDEDEEDETGAGDKVGKQNNEVDSSLSNGNRVARQAADAPFGHGKQHGESLPDLIACLPVGNVQRHRAYLQERLSFIAANSHLFFSPKSHGTTQGRLSDTHLHLVAELLRCAYQARDEHLVQGVVAVLKLLFQLEPGLVRGLRTTSSGSLSSLGFGANVGAAARVVEQSLLGHLVQVALCLPCFCDALFCLERLLLADIETSNASHGHGHGPRLVGGLEFVASVVQSAASDATFSTGYDNFAATVPSLVATARRVPAAHELWVGLVSALATLAPKVRPPVQGRATGGGNGLFLPPALQPLRFVGENNKACRLPLFALLGSLVQLHPSHASQLLQAGLVGLGVDVVLHGCMLARSGVSDAEQALVAA